jgi:hypothetical protein
MSGTPIGVRRVPESSTTVAERRLFLSKYSVPVDLDSPPRDQRYIRREAEPERSPERYLRVERPRIDSIQPAQDEQAYSRIMDAIQKDAQASGIGTYNVVFNPERSDQMAGGGDALQRSTTHFRYSGGGDSMVSRIQSPEPRGSTTLVTGNQSIPMSRPYMASTALQDSPIYRSPSPGQPEQLIMRYREPELLKTPEPVRIVRMDPQPVAGMPDFPQNYGGGAVYGGTYVQNTGYSATPTRHPTGLVQDTSVYHRTSEQLRPTRLEYTVHPPRDYAVYTPSPAKRVEEVRRVADYETVNVGQNQPHYLGEGANPTSRRTIQSPHQPAHSPAIIRQSSPNVQHTAVISAQPPQNAVNPQITRTVTHSPMPPPPESRQVYVQRENGMIRTTAGTQVEATRVARQSSMPSHYLNRDTSTDSQPYPYQVGAGVGAGTATGALAYNMGRNPRTKLIFDDFNERSNATPDLSALNRQPSNVGQPIQVAPSNNGPARLAPTESRVPMC